ncbi:unnamed protein product [Merluccius merluccius]
MYPHWHLSNPYNHYALPGGYNFGRPYMQPYPYMPYPGYILPPPPMHPVDYRRMFEPRFHPPPWTDMPRQPLQPQHPPPPGPLRREVACSEVQTEPSDAINKLIECLGKIRASELGGAERELDSGVGSLVSGILTPREEKKCEVEGATHAAFSSSSSSGAQPSPGAMFSDSTTAVYGGESSQRSLEDLGTPEAWTVGYEELPLDSSSVRVEIPDTREPVEKHDLFNLCLPDPVLDPALTAPQSAEHPAVDRRSDGVTPAVVTNVNLRCELLMKPEMEAVVPQAHAPSPCRSSAQQMGNPTKHPDEVEADLSYRILRLPFDSSSLSAGALLKNSPSLRGAESTHLTSSCLSSPVSPLYYGYLPRQKTHERLSVLSPSLDELSSRDEMFSTDLDDMDLFPRRVFTSKRLTDAITRSSGHLAAEEACPAGSKRYSCACCGKGLAKAAAVAASRRKGGGARSYQDETGDSDDDRYARSQPARVTSRKHGMHRKADSVSLRHVSKHPHKRSQCKEGSSVADGEEGRDLCVEDTADGETGEITSEMAASASQHTFAEGPQSMNMSHGAQQAQVPHQPAQGLYGASGPSEQHQLPPQHQKPFFYIQPAQSYVPMQNMQWHMPISYNPYYGYPGLSYGMPAMNPYPMNAYMDPPGYVMPQSHLHLMDYRRMLNPHYYQTLAYHSRRLHYQHNAPGRDMISSEVQTEPLSVSQKSSTAAAACGEGGGVARGEAHKGFPDGTQNCLERNCSGRAHPLPQAMSVKTDDGLVNLKKSSPSSIEKAPQKSSFLIQTEEVRIECCSTTASLEVLRSCETQELALAHAYAAQKPAHLSPVINQSPVLQEMAASAPKAQSDNSRQACPDILLVGSASCGGPEGTPASQETKARLKRGASPDSGSRVEVCGGKAQKQTGEQGRRRNNANVSRSSNDGCSKVLHAPFDLDYLDELRSMETTAWSMEDTCVPSPDWMVQNTLIDFHMETLVAEATVPCQKDLIDVFSEEVPMEQVVPMIEMPQSEGPLMELGFTGDAPMVASASPSDGLASTEVCVAEMASMAPTVNATGVSLSPSSELVVGLPITADTIQHELKLKDQSHPETSFESLPAYLPFTTWPTDRVNVQQCSEVPQTPQKHGKYLSAHASEAPIRRRKLNLESKELHMVQKPKVEKMSKIRGDRRSLSDHECCLRRNPNENAFPARRPRGARLCTRCLANHSSCMPVSPGPESPQLFKRKSPNPLQPWLQDRVPPTCEACKALHAKKRLMRRGTGSDVCGPRGHDDAGGETSENSSCQTVPKWWGPDDARRGPTDSKRHQVSRKCPVAPYPKLREKNCACDEHRVLGAGDSWAGEAPGLVCFSGALCGPWFCLLQRGSYVAREGRDGCILEALPHPVVFQMPN